MPADHSLALRQAIVEALRTDPGVSAIVASRVYGDQPPANAGWPFLRCSIPTTEPWEATRLDGSEHDVTIHCFARGPGTDSIRAMNAAVQAALDDDELPLAEIGLVTLDWERSQVVRDSEEAGSYHGIVQFVATTAVYTD